MESTHFGKLSNGTPTTAAEVTITKRKTSHRDGQGWQGFEEDMIKPFLDVFPQEDRIRIAEKTGRTLNAINCKWSKMRVIALNAAAEQKQQEVKQESEVRLKSALLGENKTQQGLSGNIPILEVTKDQKELMDKICTVIHNVNGKFFILNVID